MVPDAYFWSIGEPFREDRHDREYVPVVCRQSEVVDDSFKDFVRSGEVAGVDHLECLPPPSADAADGVAPGCPCTVCKIANFRALLRSEESGVFGRVPTEVMAAERGCATRLFPLEWALTATVFSHRIILQA